MTHPVLHCRLAFQAVHVEEEGHVNEKYHNAQIVPREGSACMSNMRSHHKTVINRCVNRLLALRDLGLLIA